MPQVIRSTQRAPKSCTECYRRKIKCSKDLPCRQCVQRGSPANCTREVVRVKGQLRTSATSGASPPYSDLVQENIRLKALLVGQSSRPDDYLPGGPEPVADQTERYEIQLFDRLERSPRARRVRCEGDILMPSKSCSEAIAQLAPRWTFWIHFAVYEPQFREEHNNLWDIYTTHGSLELVEPLWLACYFGVLASTLLFMSNTDLITSGPPSADTDALLHNWYSASLYFLDQGDYTQKPHINTVKAITILGVVFNNVGDIDRHKILWSVALRTAQQLKLGDDSAHPKESFLEQQVRRRLWWTLIICEWLPIPFHVPSINDIDFNCQLPDNVDDNELFAPSSQRAARSKPRQIKYHIIMARLARIYYQFRYKLRIRDWTAEEVTQIAMDADDELASLIEELPTFLQVAEQDPNDARGQDVREPWMRWQQQSLALVFLYYRIAINRILQQYWLQGSLHKARSRAICLTSAQAIIRSIVSDEVDISKFRPWAIALNVFSATVTLVLEAFNNFEPSSEPPEEIEEGINFLRRITSHSPLAYHGVKLITELCNSTL